MALLWKVVETRCPNYEKVVEQFWESDITVLENCLKVTGDCSKRCVRITVNAFGKLCTHTAGKT